MFPFLNVLLHSLLSMSIGLLFAVGIKSHRVVLVVFDIYVFFSCKWLDSSLGLGLMF